MEHKFGTIKASLTPQQKAFLDSKKLEGFYHPGRLMKLLSKVSVFDRLGDARRQSLSSKGKLMLVIAALSFFVTLFVAAGAPSIVGKSLFVIVFLMFATAIFLLLSAKSSRSYDINNNVRKFVLPIVAIFREESLPGSKVKIKILGDNPESPDYLVKNIPRAQKLGVSKKIYEHPWFSGSVELCDRAQLNFDLCRNICVAENRKRNQRGTKIKTKTKVKVLDLVAMQLKAPKSLYRLVATPNGSVTAEERDDFYVLKLKLKSKATSQNTPDYKLFLQQVQLLYSNLKRIG